MLLFQVFYCFFFVFAVYSVIGKWKKSALSKAATFFWLLFWLGGLVVVLWPNFVQRLADELSIGRGSDLVVYISMIVVFYLIFRLHVQIEKQNRTITKLAKKMALYEHEQKQKK